MAKNHSTYYIKSRFSKNKKRNDSLVTKFIFLKTKTKNKLHVIHSTCNAQYSHLICFKLNVGNIVHINISTCV